MTTIINLFGGPCIGKSTMAAELFSNMKKRNYNVELVTEYAKDAVWEERFNVLTDQLYIMAKQNRRINVLVDKVDYIITDSPILLGAIYTEDEDIIKLAIKLHEKHKSINFRLKRKPRYSKIGRAHNKEEALQIDAKIDVLLLDYNVLLAGSVRDCLIGINDVY
jgi:hypothetical protein